MSDASRPARIRAVRVPARGEEYRIVQLSGNLFVCSKENGSCCCGWSEKGRMPFDNSLWSDEWERRNIRSRLHLTFSGCLGPCVAGNNAMLQLFGQSIWFADLNDASLVGEVYDYAEAMLVAGQVLPAPDSLRGHVYERYQLREGYTHVDLGLAASGDAGDSDGELARLDPVCLMDVDPETALHFTYYGGRRIVFCAPSCKKQFLRSPETFMVQFEQVP